MAKFGIYTQKIYNSVQLSKTMIKYLKGDV